MEHFSKTNVQIEQASKIIFYAILKVLIPFLILSKYFLCLADYFFTDAGNDALVLPLPMWWISKPTDFINVNTEFSLNIRSYFWKVSIRFEESDWIFSCRIATIYIVWIYIFYSCVYVVTWNWNIFVCTVSEQRCSTHGTQNPCWNQTKWVWINKSETFTIRTHPWACGCKKVK